MLNDPQAAQYALLVMYAEDMYDALPDGKGNKNNLTPPIDPRVSANWTVVGFITAVDALADAQAIGVGTRFYYGFLAYSNTDNTKYVAVIRGTANASEWIEDVEFVPKPAPANMAGTVENGFFSIYGSMLYAPLGSAAGQAVVAGIATAVGGNQLTVLGHSLGSALATYLTLDLTVSGQLKNPLSACIFASPHAGDDTFAQFFDKTVASYKVYNYSNDMVPRVPFNLPPLFSYAALPKAQEFTPQDANAIIQNTLGGNHHAVCYAAMINYGAADWKNLPQIDQACAACILGPNPPLPV
jgi:triacylglycerol lipase